MRLKMKARQEVTAVTAGQYRGASKKEKRVLLDQFVMTTSGRPTAMRSNSLHFRVASAKNPSYFLNSFANASRASVGGPDEVWRSTTIRVANSSQVLRACLFTIRAAIVLLHSKRAPGSKYVH